MWTIRLPTTVKLGKKSVPLNLNWYRNAHFRSLHAAKEAFHNLVKPTILHLDRMDQVHLTYTLFVGSKQLCDVPNVCCIVDKFFADTLVSASKIPDDNYTIHLTSRYQFGGYEKGDPRVEVTIEPVGSTYPDDQTQKEPDDMKIIIVQAEIEQAITQYILNQISINDDMDIKIELSATRGEAGFTATIDIEKAEPEPEPETVTPVKTRKPRTVAATTASTQAPTPTPEPTQVQEAADEDPAFDPTEVSTAEEVDNAGNAPVEEPVNLAPATGGKSLFGGLTRPTNK